MSDYIKNFRAIHHFISGIFSNKKGEYTLSFVQDPDERWYVDIPWDGNRANLEMVAGADDLLTFLDKQKAHRVTIHVVPSEKPLQISGHTELRQTRKSTFGGSFYDTTSFIGFRMKELWLCPVTLCVLGRYPKYLYIQPV
jgi:hypothetical protein